MMIRKEMVGINNRSETVTYALDASEVRLLCASDSHLSLLIGHYGQLTYSLHTDAASFFIETIVGQMLSSKAADAISTRLYDLCGGELTPEQILKLDIRALRGIGLSGKKSEYIIGIAGILRANPDFFEQLKHAPDDEVIRRLTALRGIGTWSAKMYLIFVLNRLNVLPYEDGAFLQAYKWLYETDDIKPASVNKKCAPWSPYASLAARYLYRALDHGLTKDAVLTEKLRSA